MSSYIKFTVLLIISLFAKSESRAETDIYVPECQKVNFTKTPFTFLYGNKDDFTKWKNPIIHLFFDKESLAVTRYPGTPSVNFIIQESTIVIKDHELKKDGKINVQISGVANVFPLDNKFRDCTVYVRTRQNTFFIQPGGLNDAFDRCFSTAICEKLGSLDIEDIQLGLKSPQDYGPNSLESRTILVAHPEIYPPEINIDEIPEYYRKPNKAVKLILETLRDNFKNYESINLPELKNDKFFASEGQFKGFNYIQRDTREPIEVSESQNSLKQIVFDFGVLFGQLKYKNFLQKDKSLCVDVKELIFNADISMDYRLKKCLTLNNFKSYPGTLEMKYCNSSEIIPDEIKNWFTDLWNNILVPDFKNKLEIILKNYLQNQFECKSL